MVVGVVCWMMGTIASVMTCADEPYHNDDNHLTVSRINDKTSLWIIQLFLIDVLMSHITIYTVLN